MINECHFYEEAYLFENYLYILDPCPLSVPFGRNFLNLMIISIGLFQYA